MEHTSTDYLAPQLPGLHHAQREDKQRENAFTYKTAVFLAMQSQRIYGF